MQKILKPIYTKYATTNTLSTNTTGVYLNEATQGAAYPYVVYFLVADTHEYYLGKESYEDILIQFSIFSQTKSAVEINNLYDYLIDLYDDVVLTVSGFTQYTFFRESSFLTKDLTNNIWQYVIEYRILLEED